MSRIIKLNEEDFDARVLKADIPVLVHVGAPWCAPCRDLAPTLEKAAGEYGDRVAVVEVDSDESPGLVSRYSAGRIPNLLFFWRGRVVRQEVGVLPYASLSQMIDELLEIAAKQATS